MKRTRSDADLSDLAEQWSRLPAFRRHMYFYALLLLTTLSITALSDAYSLAGGSKKKARKMHPASQIQAARS